jgi:VIT family
MPDVRWPWVCTCDDDDHEEVIKTSRHLPHSVSEATMKSILGVSLLILLMPSAYAASLPGDSADGKRLYDANCMGCHDTSVFTRKNRVVQSLDALKKQLVSCSKKARGVGVVAAAATKSDILLAGVAGLVAGAMSMAAGEYVSVSSQSDTEQADLGRARDGADGRDRGQCWHRCLINPFRVPLGSTARMPLDLMPREPSGAVASCARMSSLVG